MPAALAAPSLKAITLNHVTVRVPDLQKTSKFYQEFFGMKLAQQSETIHILSVGESFFGIEQKPGGAALDHYDFGVQGWDAKAMRRKVAAHGLSITPGSRGDDESFKFNDPDGFVVQVNGPKYTGHVGADAKGRKGWRKKDEIACRSARRRFGHNHTSRGAGDFPQRRHRYPCSSRSRQRAAGARRR
jgi:catechol 2,3-dioxygenase-like lactoylglutathione lyase family enzyme